MFRKSSKITVRFRVVVVLGCLTWTAAPVSAQLQFAAPNNQAKHANAIPQENPVRKAQRVRQAQFRPVADGNDAPSTQPPPPGKRELSTDLPPAPPQTNPPPADQVVAEPEPIEMLDPTMEMDGDEIILSEHIPFGHFEQDFVDDGTEIYSTNAWFRRGYWYSTAEVVLMLRTGAEHVPITADNSIGIEESNMLSTSDVDPTYVPGARVTFGRFLGQDVSNRDHMIEVSFTGLFEYSRTASIVATGIEPTFGLPGLETALGPGAVFVNTLTVAEGQSVSMMNGRVTGPPVAGFSFARRNDIQYDSDFNSFEFNYRISTRPNHDRVALQPNGAWVRHATATRLFSAIAGLRAISVNELFRLQATFEDNIANGTYQVQTNNDMYGPQIGFEVVENYGRWRGGIRFKGGALYNFADRRSKRHAFFNGAEDLRDEHVSGQNLVAMLQGGVEAAYEVRPNLVARMAYDAMYLQGFATAAQNLGLEVNFPRFEVTGDAIFHGLSVGLDYMW